ncbi:YuzB family protein [Evansella cellulosilytica]|uniref:Uncharacterized protein n=1 Tax=Evansella cellulosilytica (strain ATCC 21833 / DSM 2522 / FERM P-1141 / JCM 9156 / N-4) TaxID=649639 RepID=E6U2D7_EVAC2|nr:YuzB family protein [Evansella cellulosilytica]ADU31650.1 hypothetical protein Bcell_3408 [Evansella cellulosilytica DSM 2522]
MKPIIEFCVSNIVSGTKAVKEELEKDPNLDVIEYGCLSYCGQCARKKFALVNGELVSGETNEELLANIYTFIDDNLMF